MTKLLSGISPIDGLYYPVMPVTAIFSWWQMVTGVTDLFLAGCFIEFGYNYGYILLVTKGNIGDNPFPV